MLAQFSGSLHAGLLAAADAADALPKAGGLTGSIQVGLAGLGSAIGDGLVGMKASEAVGRNPGAFGKIIAIAILGMALAEAIVFYAILMK
jgi:F-type H+-transporting ATPase subunit c